jgi:hypothetical protein
VRVRAYLEVRFRVAIALVSLVVVVQQGLIESGAGFAPRWPNVKSQSRYPSGARSRTSAAGTPRGCSPTSRPAADRGTSFVVRSTVEDLEQDLDPTYDWQRFERDLSIERGNEREPRPSTMNKKAAEAGAPAALIMSVIGTLNLWWS